MADRRPERALYFDPRNRVRRPSFQFYPDKWLSDKDLQRCTDAEQGVWMRVLCILHDSDEYGIVRWPLEDLARAARTTREVLERLWARGVLRGAPSPSTGSKVAMDPSKGPTMDTIATPDGATKDPTMDTIVSPEVAHTYSNRHATRAGRSVVILPSQTGPIWFCSRFVRDEFLRWERGKHGRKALKNPNVPRPNETAKTERGEGSESEGSDGKDDAPGVTKDPTMDTIVSSEDGAKDPTMDTIEGSPPSPSPTPITTPPSGDIGSDARSTRDLGVRTKGGEPVGPKSSTSAKTSARDRLLDDLEERVPGFRDRWEGWKASLPSTKRWTVWAEILKARKFGKIVEEFEAEEVLDMVELAEVRGWRGFEVDWWRNERGKRRGGAGGRWRKKAFGSDRRRSGSGLIDIASRAAAGGGKGGEES